MDQATIPVGVQAQQFNVHLQQGLSNAELRRYVSIRGAYDLASSAFEAGLHGGLIGALWLRITLDRQVSGGYRGGQAGSPIDGMISFCCLNLSMRRNTCSLQRDSGQLCPHACLAGDMCRHADSDTPSGACPYRLDTLEKVTMTADICWSGDKACQEFQTAYEAEHLLYRYLSSLDSAAFALLCSLPEHSI